MGLKEKIEAKKIQVNQAAILEMLSDNTSTKFGEIISELGGDSDLYAAFGSLSVADLVDHIAGAPVYAGHNDPNDELEEEELEEEELEEEEPEEEEPEEEAEEEADEEGEVEEEAPAPKAKPKAAASPKKKAPKKSPPKPGGNKSEAKADSGFNLRTEEGRGQYDSAIVTALRKLGNESSMQDVRDLVGGSPAQVRSALNRLIEVGRVDYKGKTKSTRYFLAAS